MSSSGSKDQTSIEVVSVIESQSTKPGRQGKKDAFIIYRVNGMQTFNIEMFAEDVSEANVKKAITDDFAKRGKIFTKPFTI